MDVNAITSGLYTDHSLRGSDVVNVEKKNANEDDRNTLFVNYAAIAWHEMRRAWRGDRSSASPKKPREPTRHCSNTSMEGRFDEPVPLSMVAFLVAVWEED
ncbi:uncharacterized protein LOC131020511 isoform X3 [Salvia miltiorrhiza]|uniref:uncharacterized protein LOC131020511 isoform X3 n=1 Tax=Salvia miltiorrhiza TaxID=226208 RepID=UPI0025ABDAE2|nr:uncharacterized protein LOC131020511 isoform X3 [Salvia miltiorrhiza]